MFTLNCKGNLLQIDAPIVMGIINATPDSFYSQSRQQQISDALNKANQMLQEGAVILDIGGQSTRPGSVIITEDEELKRVIPVIESIHQHFPEAIISIDTFYSKVVLESVAVGVSIVNDISGGLADTNMLSTVGQLGLPYICMHKKQLPTTVQEGSFGENIVQGVLDFFIERIDTCTKAGIHDIILDIGFGFGKTIAENYELLRQLNVFTMLKKPLLLGISRKSSIYKPLNITPEEALNGTTVLHTVGLQNGANIIRVHDVKEAIQCVQLLKMIET